MARYYVNNESQLNGDHEVHVQTCPYLPADSKYVGDYPNCFEAVKAAKKHFIWANGCPWCSRPCHIR